MPETPDHKRSVHRVDAEGRLHVGPNWETLIERHIREAIDAGKFDDLPLHGKPLPRTDNPYAGDQALAFSILKNAGVAPPWIEADKEVRELMAQRDAIFARAATGRTPSEIARRRDRANLEALVIRINAAIARVNLDSPSPRLHRRPLTAEAELARYEEACLRP